MDNRVDSLLKTSLVLCVSLVKGCSDLLSKQNKTKQKQIKEWRKFCWSENTQTVTASEELYTHMVKCQQLLLLLL
jgi:hypothetical protein